MQVALDSMQILEVKNVGNFTTNREFHLGLRGELAAPDSAPYPALEAAFLKMKIISDEAIVYRSLIKNYTEMVLRLSEGQSTKKQKESINFVVDSIYSIHIPKMQNLLDSSNAYSDFYKKLCEQNSIVRRDQLQMVELIGLQLVKWQDSLEMQGKIIAESKGLLKQKFPVQKGEVFFSKYKYVSKLEASHKLYQQDILQLENTLSRMESARWRRAHGTPVTSRSRMPSSA